MEDSMYDGNKIGISLAMMYEMQMWREIAKTLREHPELARLNIGNGFVGKAIIVSTAGERDDNSNYKNLWEEESENSTLHIFQPAYYKKEEDGK